jgi:hypothetical protein
MVAREPTSGETGDIEYFYTEVYEVTMSTNDTVTLPDFTTTANLVRYYGLKRSDLSEVTFTVNNNVLTLSSAGLTNIPLIIFAAGIKAT